MQYLLLDNVSKSYGEKTLFEGLSLSISKGDKIALVAKNGSGKTTLLRVISGEEAPEGENAKIHFAKDIKIAYLKQNPELNPNDTALEALLNSDNPAIQAIQAYEMAVIDKDEIKIQQQVSIIEDLKAWDIEVRIKEILSKLKLDSLDQTISSMSGGQQKRVALAKILIDQPDFLILDEPTNHLDLEMIEWLEIYLQTANLTLFMVTHDRYFLERVCTEIVELERGIMHVHRGNYSNFLEKKAARMANDAVVLDKTKKLYAKELTWIRRQPKARGTKAKSRVDSFDDIKAKAHINLDDDELKIHIKAARMGSKIVEAHAVQKSFGDKVILNSFTYKFTKGERVGIVGPNGAGKTTFLKLLTKDIRPDGGKVVIGDTIVFGYYTQSGMNLSEDKRVIDVIRDIAEYIPLEKGLKLTAESLLERFMFPRLQQQVYVSQLSGGEKRRLYLLTVLMENPNFLILDEPTNDLDIVTLNVLEEYLMDFPGCLIIVSHDRYFMDKLVDHMFILKGDGEVKDFPGNYTEYRNKRKIENRNQPNKEIDTEKEEQKEVKKASFEQRKAYNRVMKEIEKLEAKKAKITESFNNPDLTSEQITNLSKDLSTVNASIEEKEELWMELAELVED
ncbi:MAG: ATP-binding cassette subfamily F protein uup [Saprospiraceae bacterium]|jgi:ATP-binding cassette subfamily F protein uup